MLKEVFCFGVCLVLVSAEYGSDGSGADSRVGYGGYGSGRPPFAGYPAAPPVPDHNNRPYPPSPPQYDINVEVQPAAPGAPITVGATPEPFRGHPRAPTPEFGRPVGGKNGGIFVIRQQNIKQSTKMRDRLLPACMIHLQCFKDIRRELSGFRVTPEVFVRMNFVEVKGQLLTQSGLKAELLSPNFPANARQHFQDIRLRQRHRWIMLVSIQS